MSNPTRIFAGTCEITTGAFVPSSTPPVFQGEVQAIQVEVELLENGSPYTIPEGVFPYRYLYYDENAGHTSALAMEKDGAKVIARLSAAEQALPGEPWLVILLMDGSGNILVSCRERIRIQQLLGKTTYNTISPADQAEAIRKANEAAAVANAAADAISGLTASAETLPPGEATVRVTDIDGHKNIHIGVPRGERGEKGDQGDKGDTGAPGSGDVSTVNDISPDANGNVPLAASDVPANSPFASATLPENPSVQDLFDVLPDIIATSILESDKRKFPVGTIIGSKSSINPANYMGFGTWVPALVGRSGVGVDMNDTDFNAAGKKAGEKKHTQTSAEGYSHIHGMELIGTGTSFMGGQAVGIDGPYGNGAFLSMARTVAPLSEYSVKITNAGGGQPFNVMHPYETMHYWERTA